jgi:hypothetical protein
MAKAAPFLVAFLVFVGLTGVAPNSGGATTQQSGSPRCLVPDGSGPGFDASIGNLQNGRTVCLQVGERLLVRLTAPSNSSPWQPIRSSTSNVLRTVPLTILLTRGTIGAAFKAAAPGTVRLESQRQVCSPATSGRPTCDAVQLWEVTLVVQSKTALTRPTGPGVYGIVSAGPTCPVERAGRPCPPARVVGVVELSDATSAVVTATRTDNAGRYSLAVRAGTYRLVIKPARALLRCPAKSIVVTNGAPSRVDISCDTGIR